jgi:hypothetical protein
LKKKAKPGQRVTTIIFEQELYDQIKQIADQQERDFGSQVRFMLKEFLAREVESNKSRAGRDD